MSKLLIQPPAHFCWHNRQQRQPVILCLLIWICLLLAACGPSQAALDAQATVAAAQKAATLVALIPTFTPTDTPTATATSTATPTSTPTLTPTATSTPTLTPIPGATVVASSVAVYEGPGKEFSQVGQYNNNEELGIIGQSQNCLWIKTISRKQSLTGWVDNARLAVRMPVRCQDIPLGTYRPLTGVIRPNLNPGGYGLLTVTNSTATDSLVVLSRNGQLVTALYLRAGDSYSINHIKDASYSFYFSTGSDWNGKGFLTSPAYQRFENPLAFTTSHPATGITGTAINLTLQAVPGGNAAVVKVDGSDFPDIGN